MSRYVVERIGQAVFVLWAAFTVTFFLLQVLPADAIQIKFQSPDLGLSPDQIAAIRSSYGVDQPVFVRYLATLTRLVHADLGTSIHAGVPVTDQLAAALPGTLRLAAIGFIAAVTLGFAVALTSLLAPFRFIRAGLEALPPLFVALPTFWLAMALIQIFSFRLKLVPVIGAGPWEGLILPVITVAVPLSAPIAQVLARNLEAIEGAPFMAVIRAKGASRFYAIFAHGIRNALPPVLTIAGLIFGELLTSAIVTETVFGLNGLGRLTAEAVNNQDVSVLQAIVLIAAAGFVVINLAVDLVLPFVDPRLGRSVEVAA